MKVLYITLAVIIADQVTKLLVKGINFAGLNVSGMAYGSSKKVIGDFIKLTFIENPGMAFGIDVGPKMFLTIFTIIASFIILYYIYKHRHDTSILRIALAFILAGAVGNLLDRTFYGLIYDYAPLFHGRVVDFIQVDTWDFTIFGRTYTTWPIFNVADISVTAGFLIILFFHNRIFKHEETLSEEQAIPNDMDGSPIVDGNMIAHDGLKSENEIKQDKDENEVTILKPTDEFKENKLFVDKENYDIKDMDGSSIDETAIQPPIDEDELKKIDISIEDKQKNKDTHSPGSEETQDR